MSTPTPTAALTVLVPVDGSVTALAAVQHVIALHRHGLALGGRRV